jgi:hypothetical protein
LRNDRSTVCGSSMPICHTRCWFIFVIIGQAK